MTTPETPVPAVIHARLASVLAEVQAITKDRTNAGVDDVYNELHGLFAKHGIYVRPELLDHKQTERPTAKGNIQLHSVVKMRYHFTASDGTSVSMEAPGEAADSGDKGLGKAAQYAYKLILLQAFLIPTEGDNDPDAHATEWGAQPQGRGPQRQPPQTQRTAAPAAKEPSPPPDAWEWLIRIRDVKGVNELDAVKSDLLARVNAGTGPSPVAGSVIKASMEKRRRELQKGLGNYDA